MSPWLAMILNLLRKLLHCESDALEVLQVKGTNSILVVLSPRREASPPKKTVRLCIPDEEVSTSPPDFEKGKTLGCFIVSHSDGQTQDPPRTEEDDARLEAERFTSRSYPKAPSINTAPPLPLIVTFE